MPYLESQEAAVVVLDLFMPLSAGHQLLPELVRTYPDMPVIVMTASQEVESAVHCMKEGLSTIWSNRWRRAGLCRA